MTELIPVPAEQKETLRNLFIKIHSAVAEWIFFYGDTRGYSPRKSSLSSSVLYFSIRAWKFFL